jgi:hypothetical protein
MRVIFVTISKRNKGDFHIRQCQHLHVHSPLPDPLSRKEGGRTAHFSCTYGVARSESRTELIVPATKPTPTRAAASMLAAKLGLTCMSKVVWGANSAHELDGIKVRKRPGRRGHGTAVVPPGNRNGGPIRAGGFVAMRLGPDGPD